jgi:plastocyanin
MFPVFALISLVLVLGCIQYGAPAPGPSDSGTPTNGGAPSNGASGDEHEHIVEITASGYSPNQITIELGEEVTWTNRNSRAHWVASAVHPTHAAYPEPGGCIGSKFDSCRALEPGENWSFTFNQKGTWFYHDHLNPSNTGSVVVE